MVCMANFFDLSTPAKRFRFVAILEAFTWAGLLVGMAFKYIFGPLHGGVFVAFVLVALLTARALKWNLVTTGLALISSIPPFGTIVFEWWAARTGRLAELSTQARPADAPALA
ncbi:MAG: hypothetical protein DCC47_17165 [Acidobacteria bacterium]|nr:MAG: hypothetical protein DCC47_17165 [Acidobacteriota bacterium]